MIESLHIEDLGVIERADLVVSPGLTALTGETGAGKTMVLTSLGLLLGDRADPSTVRTGADRLLVEGAFALDPSSRAATRAREAGAELDGDLLLASRSVPAQGRSRAHLGGRSVPSAVLAEVGAHLVSVHGQADQMRLRSPSAQRAALDGLGGEEHRALCRRYARAYAARREAARELDTWQSSAQARAQEAEGLRVALAELEALDPAPGEDVALRAEADRLDHAEDLRRSVAAALAVLAGQDEAGQDQGPEVVALLAAADRALAPAVRLDPQLADAAERVHQLGIVAADIAGELAGYLSTLEADPQRLAWVHERREELSRACRSIGGPGIEHEDVDALLEWGRAAAERLGRLEGPADTGAVLAEALEAAQAELDRCADELSAARAALADRLAQAVTAELEGLQMRGARLVVALDALDEPGPTGAETVRLELSAHPGAPSLPVSKGASGGELSRVMLALEVVLAEEAAGDRQPPAGSSNRPGASRRTLVFDEIDAGVGGRAAREVGRRLARLARRHQVIVVTHLAQVAAWADTQLVVRKETGSPAPPPGPGQEGAPAGPEETAPTRTRVEAVAGRARVRELARMLSGHEDSQAALRHAAELLEEAGMAESHA
ncbi:MAG: DNA repair protein RecN [Actinomyces sp.]|uniref:DNA repair protein RecN n=1 Tax=Actinomyces sp. TaxID=29317 RepID=UPI0026DB7CC6|nr:DNA repair protein RecN [Actinomyces sp.]MDO4244178.1 DNA repair protein RecN [Actinomyces sp.]